MDHYNEHFQGADYSSHSFLNQFDYTFLQANWIDPIIHHETDSSSLYTTDNNTSITTMSQISTIDELLHTPGEVHPSENGPASTTPSLTDQTTLIDNPKRKVTEPLKNFEIILEQGVPEKAPQSQTPKETESKKPRKQASKVKVHKCPKPNCDFETLCTRTYGTHERDVHGTKSFICPDCGTRSARKDNLSPRAHQRVCKARQEKVNGVKEPPEATIAIRKTNNRVCLRDILAEKTSRDTSPQSSSSSEIDVSRQPMITINDATFQKPVGGSDQNSLFAEMAARLAACKEEIKRLKENDIKMQNRCRKMGAKLEDAKADLFEARQDRDMWYDRYRRCESRKRRRQESDDDE
ncbi:hypothetical protein TWF281_000196 [Arthrobotrys megalospora]